MVPDEAQPGHPFFVAESTYASALDFYEANPGTLLALCHIHSGKRTENILNDPIYVEFCQSLEEAKNRRPTMIERPPLNDPPAEVDIVSPVVEAAMRRRMLRLQKQESKYQRKQSVASAPREREGNVSGKKVLPHSPTHSAKGLKESPVASSEVHRRQKSVCARKRSNQNTKADAATQNADSQRIGMDNSDNTPSPLVGSYVLCIFFHYTLQSKAVLLLRKKPQGRRSHKAFPPRPCVG